MRTPLLWEKSPFTPKAKKVLEYGVEEARLMGHNYIGTEHLLLGLLKEKEGIAAKVLNALGIRLVETREKFLISCKNRRRKPKRRAKPRRWMSSGVI